MIAGLDDLTSEPAELPKGDELKRRVSEQAQRQRDFMKNGLPKQRAVGDQARANPFEPPVDPEPAPAYITPRPQAPKPAPQPTAAPTPAVSAAEAAATAEAQWAKIVESTPSAASAAPQLAGRTPQQQAIELAPIIAGLLREPTTPDRTRLSDVAAIATIESLLPGSIASIEQPNSFLGSALSPLDRQTLIDSRERLSQQGAPAIAELSKQIRALAPGPTLKIARAALCTKVSGFGDYTPYATNVFRVGSAIRAVVYIEIEDFVTRPAREGDRVAKDVPVEQQVSVDVSQSISLFQDPSGMLAWHQPPKAMTDTNRSRRRDFYLIHRIDLPSTLSIGRYNLKVQVKDLGNEAQAEVVIPITVVAQ